jgi:hypothetical protein
VPARQQQLHQTQLHAYRHAAGRLDEWRWHAQSEGDLDRDELSYSTSGFPRLKGLPLIFGVKILSYYFSDTFDPEIKVQF